jgi:hypothetical protein
MTQANDLGQVGNQARTLYRGRVNVGFQAVTSFHDGASAPDPSYPNMLWFDSGTGTVKQRDATNTSWAIIGTIGPPFKWTCIDVPPSEFTTGDAKITLKTVADSGWVMMNDGSIGDASSNASTRAYADCQALFTLLWTNITNSWCPLQNASGTPISRGASAAADWAAHSRLVLPRQLGRALAIAGGGSGLTWRALGYYLGEEAHTQTGNELVGHTHIQRGKTMGMSSGGGTFVVHRDVSSSGVGNTDVATANAGAGSPFNVMQPTAFWNVMIKL